MARARVVDPVCRHPPDVPRRRKKMLGRSAGDTVTSTTPDTSVGDPYCASMSGAAFPFRPTSRALCSSLVQLAPSWVVHARGLRVSPPTRMPPVATNVVDAQTTPAIEDPLGATEVGPVKVAPLSQDTNDTGVGSSPSAPADRVTRTRRSGVASSPVIVWRDVGPGAGSAALVQVPLAVSRTDTRCARPWDPSPATTTV